ncbi:MAG TPA: efflux RND transporter permease subunit [Syntrophales bacterium]|nr:efflux RND transporter permease subunit [Syntrophales bacterium]HPC32303.1 efflux RND transporter permease subunit [Syntrophales bacterium]HQG34045.1 efflux RND transporter permease subunit [Syntrophales bacterium]HQI35352.1 efflux RND transporter permease subunit [Syntrophales bacterium]HQJ30715.1 efflux RND transporter permease subunit [Syntrophales bacterium]
MNISALWIRRPVMTSLVMVAILFFGIIGYRNLPVNDLPQMDYPTIQVTAALPGASPEIMAATVATPLEKKFSTIQGLEAMTSTSTQGGTSITMQFSLDRNIDAAAQDVNAMISAAMGILPPLPAPPTYQKVNPAEWPIMFYAMVGETVKDTKNYDFVDTVIAPNLSTIQGVSEVIKYGKKYAVRIQVNPHRLTAKGIGINEIAAALSQANVSIPGGSLDGPYQSYALDPQGQLRTAAAYAPLIVAYEQGYPVRIRDVGRGVDSVDNKKVTVWYANDDMSQRTVVFAVRKQPGANAVEVASRVKEIMPQLGEQIPRGVEIRLLFDQTDFIKESIKDVQYTLLLTIFLVVIVIFLFLRSLQATIIPSVAVPLSLVATFAVMYLCGYSLNNLSLMALVLSVGFVVDDAIVMLENIIRRMEQEGEDALTASLSGAREIGFTILSMTVSLVVVFIPVLFMGGIVGRLLREFSVSIAAAILISGFISLTLTPMMAAVFLKKHGEKRPGRIYEASERVFAAMLAGYDWSLRQVLRHRRAALILTAVIMAGTVWLYRISPGGFIPSEDRNFFICFTMAADTISFTDMAAHQSVLNKIIIDDPDVDGIVSVAAVPNNNKGFIFARCLDSKKRKRSVDRIINELRPRMNVIPGLLVFPMNPPPIEIGGKETNAMFNYTLKSEDLDTLYRYGKEFEQRVRELPGLTDVSSDLSFRSLKMEIHIDRDKASTLGLTAEQIEKALSYAFAGGKVSTIYASTTQYDVILELEEEFMAYPDILELIYVKSRSGQLVPLNTVATVNKTLGPLAVNHQGQRPAATISFNLLPGQAIGPATEQIRKVAEKYLPSSISGSFEGAAQAFETSFAKLGFLLFVTIAVIYMVLGILYESYLHPITILSALPLAGFGALAALRIFGMELDLYAFVGIILLVGLVKKNGIMMIDFALEAERNENKTAEAAIHEACMVRFRPIMMTTMAALFGTLPIALGIGAGGESRQPLGVAVVGGLFFSQFLTMYITPVFYVYIDRFNSWLTRKNIAQ